MDLPLIVALNKIDVSSQTQINNVRQDLHQAGINAAPDSEQVIEISALQRIVSNFNDVNRYYKYFYKLYIYISFEYHLNIIFYSFLRI